jgi:hypothetical protein
VAIASLFTLYSVDMQGTTDNMHGTVVLATNILPIHIQKTENRHCIGISRKSTVVLATTNILSIRIQKTENRHCIGIRG